ncbi:uncharacterized protein BP5553_06794 [Venustampulla echinocandica]|uniref:Heterokaryon incompatibility domain-containing protein n=1 Tax=Venustampulla echinocandica TaxID=2656787 RepID=A0A370TKY0_9HELO|nr:uncharacterized protein BP5553_06794 [Venustampulla echinocandica]RDL36182.1 hypothetical protein BP5553_06794 [Venustampulla echinocandica]
MTQDSSDSCRFSTDPSITSLPLKDEFTRALDGLPVGQSKPELQIPSVKHESLYPEQDMKNESVSEESCLTNDDTDHIQPHMSNFQLGGNGICTVCQELFETIATMISMGARANCNSKFRRHYKSAMAVQESSQNGCKVCTLFIEAYGFKAFAKDCQVLEDAIGNIEPLNVPQIYLDTQKIPWTIALRLRDKLDHNQKMVLIAPVDEAPTYEIMRPSTSNYLPMAKDWLKECIDKHEHCIKPNRQVLPTRLLCLGGDSIRYMYQMFKAFNYNLQKCVPENELTKTFRDAIYITRSLGLEYLWIDSLCIIQDDDQDWLRESALMSGVYGGSTINIAAADSIDGNGGCLYDDMAIRTQRKAFRYRLRMPGLQDKRPWELSPIYLYPYCTSWSHLSSRAWTLQERFLAPRTLHFSRTDMLWECHEKEACSLFPDRLPQDLLFHQTYRKRASLASIWHLLVNLYSAAKLTRYSDKLVALSGLAQAVESETGDKYAAGMWRKDLEIQLLWYSLGEEVLFPRPPYQAPTVSAKHNHLTSSHSQSKRTLTFRFPSRSWAALNNAVTFPDVSVPVDTSTTHLYVHVHSVYTQPTGPSSLGQISGGLLTLSCSVLMRGTSTSHDNLDAEHQEVFEHQASAVALSFGGDTTVASIYWDIEEDHSGLLYFLPIVGRPPRSKSGRFKSIQGLVLRKHLQAENTVQYSRFGMFDFSFDVGLEDEDRIVRNYQAVLAIMRKQKQTTPKSDFAKTLDRNMGFPEECQFIEII